MPWASGVMNCFGASFGEEAEASLFLSLPYSTSPGTSGVFGWLPLALQGPTTPDISGMMNLTLWGPDRAWSSGQMNLSVTGGSHSAQGVLPLFVANMGVSSFIYLYASGFGTTVGAAPASASMNLFIRKGEGAILPLFVKGPGYPSSGILPLYVFGAQPTEGTLFLYSSGVGTLQSDSLPLMTAGWG